MPKVLQQIKVGKGKSIFITGFDPVSEIINWKDPSVPNFPQEQKLKIEKGGTFDLGNYFIPLHYLQRFIKDNEIKIIEEVESKN